MLAILVLACLWAPAMAVRIRSPKSEYLVFTFFLPISYQLCGFPLVIVQCCGSKYIEFGTGFKSCILAQFGIWIRIQGIVINCLILLF